MLCVFRRSGLIRSIDTLNELKLLFRCQVLSHLFSIIYSNSFNSNISFVIHIFLLYFHYLHWKPININPDNSSELNLNEIDHYVRVLQVAVIDTLLFGLTLGSSGVSLISIAPSKNEFEKLIEFIFHPFLILRCLLFKVEDRNVATWLFWQG